MPRRHAVRAEDVAATVATIRLPFFIEMFSHASAECRRGRGEENERVTVRLFAIIAATVLADGPDIAAIDSVAVAVPKKIHAMVDDQLRPRSPHQPGNRKAID